MALAQVSSLAALVRLADCPADEHAHILGMASLKPIFVSYSSKHRDLTKTLDHVR